MEKKILDGGVNLYTIKSDKFKSWSASMYIYRPLNEEEASFNALLAKVLKTSTHKYPTRRELGLKLDSMYGAVLTAGVRKYADSHALIINVKGVCDKFLPEKVSEQILGFLKQVIIEPNVKNEEFDSLTVEVEKENLIKQIESYINDKTFYADIKGLNVLCNGDNYAVDINGSIDVINKISPKSLYEHYLKIINDSPKDIFLCGEADEVAAENVFNNLKSAERKCTVAPFKPDNDIKTEFEELDVTQGKLIMGFCFPDTSNDYRCTAMVFNAIFGGSTTSKLFNNVREKLSLAYYANTRMSFAKGIIFARSGIEISKFNETKDEIINQLNLIKKGEITQKELENSKAHIINLYTALEDDPESTVSLVSGWITENETRMPDEIIKGIEKVTAEEVVDFAAGVELKAIYFLKNKEGDK